MIADKIYSHNNILLSRDGPLELYNEQVIDTRKTQGLNCPLNYHYFNYLYV